MVERFLDTEEVRGSSPLAPTTASGRGSYRRGTMGGIDTSPSAEGRHAHFFSLKRLRLRFRDRALESTFRDYRFHLNLGNVRFAFVAGITMWIFWGILMRHYILALADQRLDIVMRFGICIPILV